MENTNEFSDLANMVLAPWIAKATALRACDRKVGGNQFRHAMATLGILIDYHYISPVTLKAAIIHDLIEDIPSTNMYELEHVDHDSPKVISLVLEVTRRAGESKPDFLKRIRNEGSKEAKIIKCADRISNLTDLHKGIFDKVYMESYINQTEEYVYPIALEVDKNMAFEINDLITRRRKLLISKTNKTEPIREI
jgi:(p)ppGpp synthase/HD superfamily hydrolase